MSRAATLPAGSLPSTAISFEGWVRDRETTSGTVPQADPRYPLALRHLADPPPQLHWRGDVRWLGASPAVAIVGARSASESGREIAHALARDLAVAGCLVVSGLARGIDAAAHEGALDGGGATLAVLGTGLDICYPAEHARLSERIAARGLLVSEFSAGTEPRPYHFPQRNRVLAALSDVVVIVEGEEKSGARSTVDHALDLGREVMAVPRDILHLGSALPNRLLRDGASPVLGVADILGAIPSRRGQEVGGESVGDEAAGVEMELRARLLAALDRGRLGQEALAQLCVAAGATPAGAARLICRLELEGQIRRGGDGYERTR